MERAMHLGSVTTNHWTGSGQGAMTFSVDMFHYIKKWSIMCLPLLDFKVFNGTTSSQAIFKDQKDVLKLT